MINVDFFGIIVKKKEFTFYLHIIHTIFYLFCYNVINIYIKEEKFP